MSFRSRILQSNLCRIMTPLFKNVSVLFCFLSLSTLRMKSDGPVSRGFTKKIVSLPHESDDGHIRIRSISSIFKRLETDIGLDILLGDDSRIYITLTPDWLGKVLFVIKSIYYIIILNRNQYYVEAKYRNNASPHFCRQPFWKAYLY